LSGPQLDHAFWRFSLRIYRAPGVADECLTVQERYGIDVNLMLFCAWLAAEHGVVLTAEEFANSRAVVREWHERAVKPLRAARQHMKGLADVEPLRTQVKGLELEAERIEQQRLFAFALSKWPKAGDATSAEALRNNLDLFVRAHGAPNVDIVPLLLRAIAADIRRTAASA
jgi:uncharacterized protein (TIGR02444 family)